jgi:hypothetical protein
VCKSSLLFIDNFLSKNPFSVRKRMMFILLNNLYNFHLSVSYLWKESFVFLGLFICFLSCSRSGLEYRDYGHRGSAALTTRQPSSHKSWH